MTSSCVRGYVIADDGTVRHVAKPLKVLARLCEFGTLAEAADVLAARRHLSRLARERREEFAVQDLLARLARGTP